MAKTTKKRRPPRALLAALVLATALGGCGGQAAPGGPEATKPEGVAEAPIPSEPEEEEPRLPLGLYVNNGSGVRELAATVEAAYAAGKDIVVLSAFLSGEPSISGGAFAKAWNELWAAIPEAAGCKIGYRLSYETASGETVRHTILGPEDTGENREYIETYIYDDVHQDGWYSHLLPADVTEQTVVTTIKLTGGPEAAGIGDITVEAFLYDKDPLAGPAGQCEVIVTPLP